MPKIPADALRLGDNRDILVWLREDTRTPQYYARFTLPMAARAKPTNPYLFRSLETTDQSQAILKAFQIDAELRAKLKRGEAIVARSFRKVAEEWITHMQGQAKLIDGRGRPLVVPSKLTRYVGIANRYLIPYFGDRPIASITDDDTASYLRWRRTYYQDGPGKGQSEIEYERNGIKLRRRLRGTVRPAGGTINKDCVVLRTIFVFAVDQRYLSRSEVPHVESPTIDGTRRPDFTREEWNTMKTALRAGDRHRHGPTRRARKLLKSFCWFLRVTGLRVSEAMALRWEHIQETDSTVRIRIPPNLPGLKSPKHARTVIPLPAAHMVVRVLHRYYQEDGIEPTPSDPVWMNLDRTPIDSFDHSFSTLLKQTGLLLRDGERRSLSSFRHTYATEQLYKGTDTHILAKNMGTSEGMIHKHYAHILLERMAEQLGRDDT